MKIVFYLFLLEIGIFTRLCFSFSQFPFPKKLWTFWDEPNNLNDQKSTVYVNICHQHLKKVSKQYGWEFNLISSDNIKLFIDNYKEDWEDVIKNAKYPLLQSRSDLARLLIIEKYGGIYIDITTILINGFEWLQNIDNYRYLITNKVQRFDPDVILFSFSLFQNNLQFRNPTSQSLINQHPGLQGWFIAAKPQSNFIKDWLKWFQTFYQMRLEEKLEIFQKEGVYYRNLQTSEYLNVDKSLDYTLQRKQFQLDRNLSIFSSKSDRILATNHYKVWSLSAQYGPFAFISGFLGYQSLVTHSLSQLQQNQFQIKFFVKTSHVNRGNLQRLFNIQTQMINQNITFNHLSSYTSSIITDYNQCIQTKFPVKGSVIDILLKQNTITKQKGYFSINKLHQIQWQNFCNQKYLSTKSFLTPIISKLLLNRGPTIQQIAKPHQIILYENQNLDFIDLIKIYYKIYIVELKIAGKQLFYLTFMIFAYKIMMDKVFKSKQNDNLNYRNSNNQNQNNNKDANQNNNKDANQNKKTTPNGPQLEIISQFKTQKPQIIKSIFYAIFIIIFTVCINVKFELFNTYGVRKQNGWLMIVFIVLYHILKNKIQKENVKIQTISDNMSRNLNFKRINLQQKSFEKLQHDHMKQQDIQPINYQQLQTQQQTYQTVKQSSLHQNPNNQDQLNFYLNISLLWQICQPMIILGLGQLLLSFFIVRQNHLFFSSVYVLLFGVYFYKKSKFMFMKYHKTINKQQKLFILLQKYIFQYDFLNKYLLIGCLIVCQITNVQYIYIDGRYPIRYLIYLPIIYASTLFLIVIIHQTTSLVENIKSNHQGNSSNLNIILQKYYLSISSVLQFIFVGGYLTVTFHIKFHFFQYEMDFGLYHAFLKVFLLIFIAKNITLKSKKYLLKELSCGEQLKTSKQFGYYLIIEIIVTFLLYFPRLIIQKLEYIVSFYSLIGVYLIMNLACIILIISRNSWNKQLETLVRKRSNAN